MKKLAIIILMGILFVPFIYAAGLGEPCEKDSDCSGSLKCAGPETGFYGESACCPEDMEWSYDAKVVDGAYEYVGACKAKPSMDEEIEVKKEEAAEKEAEKDGYDERDSVPLTPEPSGRDSGCIIGKCIAGDMNCDGKMDPICPSKSCAASEEVCNNRDDDCDGVVDDGVCLECSQCKEGFVRGLFGLCSRAKCESIGSCCYKPVIFDLAGKCGPCDFKEEECVPEVCNGIDDSCEGTTDEGCPRTSCRSDLDCENYEFCYVETHKCIHKHRSCESDKNCDKYEICDDGSCVLPQVTVVLYPDDKLAKQSLGVRKDWITNEIKNTFSAGLNINSCKEFIKVVIEDEFEDNEFGTCSYPKWKEITDYFKSKNPYYWRGTIFVSITGSYSGLTGRTCGRGIMPSVIYSRLNPRIITHEMGHSFGLLDEYCWNPPGNPNCPRGMRCDINPTDPELGGNETVTGVPIDNLKFWDMFDKSEDPPYYCTKKTGNPQYVWGNRWSDEHDGRSHMGAGDAPSPRGWDKYEVAYLNDNRYLTCR